MYVPLRVHGNHSLLTGVDPPQALLRRAQELGLEALVLADVNSTAGWIDFIKAARSSPSKGGLPVRREVELRWST